MKESVARIARSTVHVVEKAVRVMLTTTGAVSGKVLPKAEPVPEPERYRP